MQLLPAHGCQSQLCLLPAVHATCIRKPAGLALHQGAAPTAAERYTGCFHSKHVFILNMYRSGMPAATAPARHNRTSKCAPAWWGRAAAGRLICAHHQDSAVLQCWRAVCQAGGAPAVGSMHSRQHVVHAMMERFQSHTQRACTVRCEQQTRNITNSSCSYNATKIGVQSACRCVWASSAASAASLDQPQPRCCRRLSSQTCRACQPSACIHNMFMPMLLPPPHHLPAGPD